MPEDRAVSDAIGFVLVFGIIISMVAVVFVGGFNSIQNARQYERMNNAERAFEVFADNVEDITQRGAPSRATEIKLADAAIQSGPVRTIVVNVTRASTHSKNLSTTVEYRPIVYESLTNPSNEMVYELGATFRASRSGTTMSTEPTWVLQKERVVIPIIQTVHTGGSNVTGSRTILIKTALSSSEVLVSNTSHTSDVYINITTPRAEAWRRFLRDKDAVECKDAWGQTSTFVSCRVADAEIVYVTYFQINYEFV